MERTHRIPVNLLIESSQQKKRLKQVNSGGLHLSNIISKLIKDHLLFVFVFETLCLCFVLCHVFGFSFGKSEPH